MDGRCHRAGTGQTTLEVIGSKRGYALKWCKPDNDDDDDDDDEERNYCHQSVEFAAQKSLYARIICSSFMHATFSNLPF